MTRFLQKCLCCGPALSDRFGRAVKAVAQCCEGRNARRTTRKVPVQRSVEDDALWIMMMLSISDMFPTAQPSVAYTTGDAPAFGA